MTRQEKEEFIRKVADGLSDLSRNATESAMWIHEESDEQLEHVYLCLLDLHGRLPLVETAEKAKASFRGQTTI